MSKPKSVLEVSDLPVRTTSGYPPQFAKPVAGRSSVALGDAFDLTQFGAKIVTLEPGAWSSQRHWHENEDELVYALEGQMVLVDNDGRHAFTPGKVAGFKAKNGNGHHFINESDKPAKFLVIGTRAAHDLCHYSDVDLKATQKSGKVAYTKRDGSKFAD